MDKVSGLDKAGKKVAKKLIREVINEHYLISKEIDSNLSYLWWMYKDGAKKDQFKPFIFKFELNLLQSLDIINSDQVDHLSKMLDSEDLDNVYIAVCSISHFRKERIDKHGEFLPNNMVSDEFKEVAKNYPVVVVNNYKSFLS